jgi:ankyrin repeat protein
MPPQPVDTAQVQPSDELPEQDVKLALSACERGNLQLLRSLVPDKVPVSASKVGGRSLLHIAAYRGQTEIVRYLLQQQAEPNVRAVGGYTSLHQAARRGHRDVALALLAGGADVHAGDGDFIGTPLHVAVAEAGGAELGNLLLSHGARTESRDGLGRTPLMLAVAKQHNDVLDVLLAARADVNAVDNRKDSVLGWAALAGNANGAARLLDKGARVDEPNDAQMTPLFHAANNGQAAVVAALLERGARPDCSESRYGDSALMRAANDGQLEIVRLLVERRADLEHENKDGLTAFIMAARNGHRDVVDFLLAKRADARHKDRKGKDALDWARFHGQKEMTSFLEELLAGRD